MLDILSSAPYFLIILIVFSALYHGIKHRSRDSIKDPSGQLVRRIYFYTLTLISILMIAFGVVQTSTFILEGIFGESLTGAPPERAAIGISLIIVGTPLWFIHWRIVNTNAKTNITERLSGIRQFYIYALLVISMAIVTDAMLTILASIFQLDDLSFYHICVLPVFVLIWFYHWQLQDKERSNTLEWSVLRTVYIYGFTLVGLLLLSTGTGVLIQNLLKSLIEEFAGNNLILQEPHSLWQRGIGQALCAMIAGGIIWSLHWLIFARKELSNILASLYLYFVALLGGGIPIIASCIILLQALLGALMGTDPDQNGNSSTFYSSVLSSLAIGGAILSYHWWYIRRQELTPQSGQINSSAVFYHSYVFIGVLVLGSGVALSINTILSFFTGYNDIALPSSGALKGMSSISITLILVGTVVWAYSWRQVQSNWITVTQGYYTARRTYIFSILGISILTAVVSLATLLFLLLKDLLSAQFTTGTVEAINPSISILITLAPIIGYHIILKRQQESLNQVSSTSKPRNRKRILILVPNDDQNFATTLERALGYPVARVNCVDEGAAAQSLENIDLDDLVSGIEQSVGAGVILIPEPGGIRIYSYN